jgi:hypothetical protein
MKRDYWRPDHLIHAARLLEAAAANLHVTYPSSASAPNKATLPAVLAMIRAAEECIIEAQPSVGDE